MNSKNNKFFNIITKQIGRKPEGMDEVSLICPFDYPAVIKVYPFFNERVFPTTYWLTCPYLEKEISILEDSGLIEQLQTKINEDKKLKALLNEAHQQYAKSRMKMLSEREIAKIKEISKDILDTLKNSGVGGIKEKKGLKCLHTHVADYLVNNLNPVGKIVFEKIGWPKQCSICEELENNEEGSH